MPLKHSLSDCIGMKCTTAALYPPHHHLKGLCVITSCLSATIGCEAFDSFSRSWMRIKSHYATIHWESLHLSVNSFFPYLNPCIRLESVHSRIQCPNRATRHLHIPEFLDWLHFRPTLKQPDSLLTSHWSLQMVIIEFSRLVSDWLCPMLLTEFRPT